MLGYHRDWLRHDVPPFPFAQLRGLQADRASCLLLGRHLPRAKNIKCLLALLVQVLGRSALATHSRIAFSRACHGTLGSANASVDRSVRSFLSCGGLSVHTVSLPLIVRSPDFPKERESSASPRKIAHHSSRPPPTFISDDLGPRIVACSAAWTSPSARASAPSAWPPTTTPASSTSSQSLWRRVAAWGWTVCERPVSYVLWCLAL